MESTREKSLTASHVESQAVVLVFENISKSFTEENALDGVSLTVRPGELHGVIGPDGAGKSTLLAIAAGVLLEDSGSVKILGADALSVRDQVGYVPQNLALFEDLTVEENIDYQAGLNLVALQDLKSRKEHLLREFTLSSFRQRPAGKLSGGMKQKLALCLALINKPKLVILDEPTTGLDPRASREMWWHLRSIAREGVAVLVATPNLEEASLLDRLVFIHRGKELMTGSPEDLVGKASVAPGDESDAPDTTATTDLSELFRMRLEQEGEKKLTPKEFPSFNDNGRRGRQDVAIRTKDLKKKFGDFEAVTGLNLEVGYGEVFGLLGANGAGKTTSVKMICGLIKPTEGSISIAGKDAGKRRSLELRKRIGYMSQKVTLYDRLKVKENLDFYATVYEIPSSIKGRQINWVVEACGLEDILDKKVGQLPPGWKQRVSFAASIMHDPEVIFLDEPTAGVDPLAREQLWNLTEELKKSGKAILVTTHYMDEARRCDRLALMSAGTMKVSGSPGEIRASVKDYVSCVAGNPDEIEVLEERLQRKPGTIISIQRERGKLLLVHEEKLEFRSLFNEEFKEITGDLGSLELLEREATLDDAFIVHTRKVKGR